MKALKAAGLSLAPVAIQEVLDLTVKNVDANWDRKRRAKLEQRSLFDEPKSLEKIPFEFRFRWRDHDSEEHDSLVISWEMAETWRKYRKSYENPIEKMKGKLLGDCFGPSRQSSFFMGNHSRFRNTFMVCGWFIPPKREMRDEFLW